MHRLLGIDPPDRIDADCIQLVKLLGQDLGVKCIQKVKQHLHESVRI